VDGSPAVVALRGGTATCGHWEPASGVERDRAGRHLARKEVVDLHLRVPVVAVPYLAAVLEQSIRIRDEATTLLAAYREIDRASLLLPALGSTEGLLSFLIGPAGPLLRRALSQWSLRSEVGTAPSSSGGLKWMPELYASLHKGDSSDFTGLGAVRLSSTSLPFRGRWFRRCWRLTAAWPPESCRTSAKTRQRRTLSASRVALPGWISQPALWGASFRVGVGPR
jgi:hypothetical protein